MEAQRGSAGLQLPIWSIIGSSVLFSPNALKQMTCNEIVWLPMAAQHLGNTASDSDCVTVCSQALQSLRAEIADGCRTLLYALRGHTREDIAGVTLMYLREMDWT